VSRAQAEARARQRCAYRTAKARLKQLRVASSA
jgi:hypothetical protein